MKAKINFSCFFIIQVICILFFTTTSQAQPALEWTARLTGGSEQYGKSVATDKLGNLYVMGYFSGKVDFDNGAGYHPLTSASAKNLFITKYDSSGALLWVKTLETSNELQIAVNALQIAVDDSCNIYFTGLFKQTVDFDPDTSVNNLTTVPSNAFNVFVCKWDSSGTFLWANKINYTFGLSNFAISLTINEFDAIHLAGSITGNLIFTLKYSSSGSTLFSNFLFFDLDIELKSLSVDASGNIIASGLFSDDSVDVDPGAGVYNLYENSGKFFILKLNSTGDFIWAKTIGKPNELVSKIVCLAITTDSLNNIYFTGSMKDTIDFDPGPGVHNLIADAFTGGAFIACFDSSSSFVFAKVLGKLSTNNMSIMLNNSIVVSGSFSVPVDFDPGPMVYTLTPPYSQAGFLAKYDLLGNFIYAKNLGGKSLSPLEIDVNSNIFMTGFFDNTTDFDPSPSVYQFDTPLGIKCFFYCKLDSSGNLILARGSQGSYAYPYDQDVDQDGNFYTTGFFAGNLDFDPDTGSVFLNNTGDSDAFIQKINSSGKLAWAKSFGGSNVELGYKVKSDNSGNVYVSGTFYGTIDCDPGPAVYNLTLPGILTKSTFLLKLDESGNFVWATTIFDYEINNNLNYDMEVDGSGNIFFTGIFTGTIDLDPGPGSFYLTAISGLGTNVFMMKLNHNGIFEWGRSIEPASSGSAFGRNVTVDGSGNSIFSGEYYFDTIDFDPGPGVFNMTAPYAQSYFLKLDPLGNFIWAKQIGSYPPIEDYYVTCRDMYATSDGDLFITGDFEGEGPIDFDPNAGIDTVTSSTIFSQNFVAKWDSAGNLLWKSIVNGVLNSQMAITELNSGNVFFTGTYYSNIYLSNLDSTGGLLFYDDFANKDPYVDTDERDNIYLSGLYNLITDFDWTTGNYSLIPSTPADFFIAKYSKTKPVCSVSPTAIFANAVGNTICSGQNIALSQSGGVLSPGGIFEWYVDSCGGTLIDTGESITVAPTDTTTYFMRIVDSCGVSNCLSVTINVNSSPLAAVVTGNSLFCQGDSIILTATLGYQSYLWSTGSQTPSSYANSGGTYIVTVTSLNGCTNSTSVQVTTYPNPPVTISPASKVLICLGDTVPFSVTNNAGYTYQWYRNAIPLAGETTSSFNAFSNGLYSCMVTDQNSCDSITQGVRVKIICLPPFDEQSKIENGTVTPFATEMMVFYDMSTTTAHIKINNKNSTNFHVQLTDVTGKVLYNNYGLASIPDYEYKIDCSSLTSGIYLITLKSNHETLTGKLVKP